MNLLSGTTLQGGKYTIVKVLGQGSFGITYLAMARFKAHGALGEMDVEARVAIKEFFMSEINSRREDGSSVEGSKGTVFLNYRKKFKKEAENLAHLSHSNIVRVFDVFDENNTSYYVMEYLDGQNLDEYITAKGRLGEEEAIDIIREVGGALAYMHSQKMLHLDIKPKNVMRRADGHYYLIDFGLSKQFADNGEPETSTTIGLGTPGYAPLEQGSFRKDGTFPATLDVYALGATLFKMLTGKRLPEASTILNNGFPEHDLTEKGISDATIATLRKSLSPVRHDRFPTVVSMLEALSTVTVEADDETGYFSLQEESDKENSSFDSGGDPSETNQIEDVVDAEEENPFIEEYENQYKTRRRTKLIWAISIPILVVMLIWMCTSNSGGYETNYDTVDCVAVTTVEPYAEEGAELLAEEEICPEETTVE